MQSFVQQNIGKGRCSFQAPNSMIFKWSTLFFSEIILTFSSLSLLAPLSNIGKEPRKSRARKQLCAQLLIAQLCSTLYDPMDCSSLAVLSMGFSRKEYWSGLPCLPLGDLSNPGLPHFRPSDSLPSEPPGKPMMAPFNQADFEIFPSSSDYKRTTLPWHSGHLAHLCIGKALPQSDTCHGKMTCDLPWNMANQYCEELSQVHFSSATLVPVRNGTCHLIGASDTTSN